MPRRKRSLHEHLKHAFIPHKGNGYHPHVLREHHLIGHAAAFTALKVGLILFATLIPSKAFLAPNVLAAQGTRIVELTNALRKEQGLTALSIASLLINSSQDRANDMAEKEYFSHASPDGKRLNWFLRQAGYPYRDAGENLAMGFSDADSAMDGWIKSPTHYGNLVDTAFEETGIGIRAGVFQEKPTIFLVQHFGARVAVAAEPVKKLAAPKETVTLVARVAKPVAAPKPPVVARAAVVPLATIGVPEPVAPTIKAEPTRVSVPLVYDADRSFVAWEEVRGQVRVSVEVFATGDIQSAQTHVRGNVVPLIPKGDGRWVGGITLPQSAKELFRVVIPPTVRFLEVSGQVTQAPVMWRSPKIVIETPWERYLQAKSWLSASMPIFPIIRALFLIGGGFFALALFVNLVIKIVRNHKQHPRVALQTAALVAMLLLYAKW